MRSSVIFLTIRVKAVYTVYIRANLTDYRHVFGIQYLYKSVIPFGNRIYVAFEVRVVADRFNFIVKV